MHNTPRDVLVVGGGYAGVLAANRLAHRLPKGVRVTLLSDRDDLVHRVRLHEALAGRPFGRHPLRAMLAPRVAIVRGRAERLDARARRVVTDRGDSLPYDLALLAIGSSLATDVAGVREHAAGLASPESAARGAARLRELAPGSCVTVVGGSFTAIEAASEIAEAHPHLAVTLLASTFGPAFSDRARDHARESLDALGVRVREGDAVREVCDDAVVLCRGERVPSAMTVWGGGFKPAGPNLVTDLARDGFGRLLIDGDLRAVGHDDVFVAGDAAAPPPGMGFLRMGCASAMPMGAHAADNLARVARGEDTTAHRFAFVTRCTSFGRERALVESVRPDDTPDGRIVTGRTGALIKELICRYVIGMIRAERWVAGAYQWPRAVQAELPPRLGAGETAGVLRGEA